MVACAIRHEITLRLPKVARGVGNVYIFNSLIMGALYSKVPEAITIPNAMRPAGPETTLADYTKIILSYTPWFTQDMSLSYL